MTVQARLTEDRSELTITQAESRVIRSGRPVLSAVLDEAVTLKLQTEDETPDRQPTAGDRASFTVLVAEFDADEFRRC